MLIILAKGFTVMDAATATLIGISITGILGLFVTWLNNRHQLQLQREQWERQEKKEQVEYNRRANESALQRDAEFKRTLQDMYVDGVRTLSAALISFSASSLAPQIDHIQQVQKALVMISIYHYDKQSSQFKQFYDDYYELMQNSTASRDRMHDLRQTIIEFSQNDPRLK